MKNFMTLLEFFDQAELPNTDQSLNKRRLSMPQIETNQFLQDIENNPDVGYTKDVVDTDMLVPTQSQFNDDKVKSIVMGLRSGGEQKPIIVSNDNFVIDGHHRWAAHNNIGLQIPVIRVGMNASDLLEYLKGKDYVQNKSINEDVKHLMEMTNPENMKRQLLDLLRLRVQKSIPSDSKEFSTKLAMETDKLNAMSDEDVNNEYTTQVINNKILPIGD